MNLTCSFSTVNPAAADVDLLVVPVYANGELGPGAEVVAAAFTGAISDYMAAAGFAGKPGQILRVPVSGLPALSALLVVFAVWFGKPLNRLGYNGYCCY